MNTTTQRVAVVTGGSRGIGRKAAERLAADGYAVVVTYVAGKDDAVTTITAVGGRAIAVQADVAEVVSFLAGPARWVNGQVICTNGGIA